MGYVRAGYGGKIIATSRSWLVNDPSQSRARSSNDRTVGIVKMADPQQPLTEGTAEA